MPASIKQAVVKPASGAELEYGPGPESARAAAMLLVLASPGGSLWEATLSILRVMTAHQLPGKCLYLTNDYPLQLSKECIHQRPSRLEKGPG